MSYAAERYEQFIQRFVAWAETVPDIRAAVVIGSRARTERPADEWSDLDLVFFTMQPQFYITTTFWLDALGPYWLSFMERTPGGEGRERRVMFDGALDVDFVPLPSDAVPSFFSPAPQDLDFIRRGFRIVLDKDGALSEAARALPPELLQPVALPPDEDTFLNVVNDFWYHAVWSAKKLRRGEWWTAAGCINTYMKGQCVLPMITWHAQGAHGGDYDTWMNGRFLDQWADPRVIDGLRSAYGRYEADDLWRALFGTMSLFRWLAADTARMLGYPYPAAAEQQVTAWVKRCFEGRQTSPNAGENYYG